MYIPVLTPLLSLKEGELLIIFLTPPMGFHSTLNRLLTEPDARERAVLETDVVEQDDNVEGNATAHSFLNTLAGDLDARVIGIHKNTNQRLIVVTQDKTLLTLKRNIAKLGKREWIAPLSTLSTISIALITSNFKRALGLGPAEWRAIFIVCGFISMGWLVATLKREIGSKSFHEVINCICYELGARPVPTKRKRPTKKSTISAGAVIAACRAKPSTKKKSRKKTK